MGKAEAGRRPGRGLRRLAIVYAPQSIDPLLLAEASTDRWETIWVVDRLLPGMDVSATLLARLGRFVDISGLSEGDAAVLVRAHSPAGITTFAETELARTARLALQLGLPFFSPAAAARLSSKVAQRRALAVAGLDVPRYWEFPHAESAQERSARLREVCFPVIVKPQAGSSSRNTREALDAGDLEWALRELDNEPSGLIVEELLADGWSREDRPYGDYVSVESFQSNDVVWHAAVAGRRPLAEPFRETGAFVPSNLPRADQDELMRLAGRAILALDAECGAFHTEIKLTPYGPRIIEVNGRLGGQIADLIALASGHSILQVAASVAFGDKLSDSGLVPCHSVAYVFEAQAPTASRKLLRLDGLDRIGALAGVQAVSANRSPGDLIDWREGSGGYMYRVLGTAPNHEEMWKGWRAIEQAVEIELA